MFEENSIIDRILSGDQGAFGGLIDRYENRVYQYAFRFLGDEAMAAEATRAIFVRMHQTVNTADGDLSLAVWVYRIATNICADAQKKRRISWAGRRSDDPVNLEEAVSGQLLRLPRQQREILILRDISQLSSEEIGAVLDLEQGVVQARLARARRNLRNFLVTAGQMDSVEEMKRHIVVSKADQHFRELASLYVDGNIGDEDKKKLLDHIQECKACSAYLEDLTRLGRVLAHMEQCTPPEELRAQITERVKELSVHKAPRRHRVNLSLVALVALFIGVLMLIISGRIGSLYVNSGEISKEQEVYRTGTDDRDQSVKDLIAELHIPEAVASDSYAFAIAASGGTELPLLSSSAKLLAVDQHAEYYAVSNDVGMMQRLANMLESLGYTIEPFNDPDIVINAASGQGLFVIVWDN